jgi:glutamate-1-semialdehyde 2,1-aminomutase
MEEGRSYGRLEETSARLERGLKEEADRAGVALSTNRRGSMLGVFFSEARVTNFEEAKRSCTSLYATFHRSMLEEGIYLPPSAFETIFLSTAHTQADVDATVKASRKAFTACAARRPKR